MWVVNSKRQEYDIFIGPRSPWANPFRDKTPKENVEKFKDWLEGLLPGVEPNKLKWINSNIEELRGKTLGCDCSGQCCHGHALVAWLNMQELLNFNWDITFSEGNSLMLLNLCNLVRSCNLCSLGKKSCEEQGKIFDPHVFSNLTHSKFMVVGQNPGVNECLGGEPFVGDAGKFFDEQIETGGLERRHFYITNSVKCHSLANEKPTKDQVESCESYLRLEIKILKPKLVITLGSVAFDVFCPDKVMNKHLGDITRSEKFGVNVFPIYHPSPRNMMIESRKNKFIEDISNLCKLVSALSARP